MFEIHVNVGRFIPRLGHKAFKHHRADFRGNAGHPQRIAHHRIRRRSAPLAQDAPAAGEIHDVMHRQEIGLILQLADQREFMRHLRPHPLWRALWIAPVQPRLRQPRQAPRRRFTARHLGRVFIAQLIQRKAQTGRDLARAMHRCLMVPEQAQHLGLGPQALFGMGQRAAAQRIHPHPQPDRGQHISQPPPRAVMQDRHCAGHRVDAQALGHPRQPGKARRILPIIARCHQQMALPAEPRHQRRRPRLPIGHGDLPAPGRMQQHHQPRAPIQQILKPQIAMPLGHPQPPGGYHPAEPPPCRPVAGQRRQGKPAAQHDPRRRDQPDRRCPPLIGGQPRQFPRLGMGPHDPRDRVFIRNRQPRHAHLGGTRNQLLGVRRPDKKGEIRKGRQFDKGHGSRGFASDSKRTL